MKTHYFRRADGIHVSREAQSAYAFLGGRPRDLCGVAAELAILIDTLNDPAPSVSQLALAGRPA